MPVLSEGQRKKLEKAVGQAREVAERGARAAIEQLAVHRPEPFAHLSADERNLRNRLRARARQLGDRRDARSGEHPIDHLIVECAYEHWHRMLFARFLAENNVLMHPDGVAVTLEECEELASDEGAEDGWALAARYATRMLPQIFRPDAPVLEVKLPPERQRELERLLADLPPEVFKASDSLGWVYQFWQAKKKDEVNKSEVKIGADELPAVTQLFTEPYMVQFLLHNTLGAWWAGKVAAASSRWSSHTSERECRRVCSLPGLDWEHLRFAKTQEATGESLEFGYFDRNSPLSNLSGTLPHRRQEGVTYFVTFRTADSLPREKLEEWQAAKAAWIAAHPEPHDESTRRAFYKTFPDRLQRWLDQGYGSCLLRHPELRLLVEKALKHFDGVRYDLDACVVSANHVHALVTPKDGHQLSNILHSWKSFTANQINRKAGCLGAFWQKETFDHIVRSPTQLEKIRAYIRGHGAVERQRQDAATAFVPAAGSFKGWPKTAAELTLLDPCCGSGHFLVAAFEILVHFRMAEETLSPTEACDAVLRENLHGLEIDERCTQIAAFALALAAWTFPGAGGYRMLPEMHIACSGLAPRAKKSEWLAFAGGDQKLKNGMARLYDLFEDAPVLGSLIDPQRLGTSDVGLGELFEASFDELRPLLAERLHAEESKNLEQHELGITAQGIAKAAELLADQYHLVITNVPYLTRGKQGSTLRDFLAKHHGTAKNDLATAFLERCLAFDIDGGTSSLVMPQNWLFLTSYRKLREMLLKNESWQFVARLGPGAFETISGEVVKAVLLSLNHQKPIDAQAISGLDVSELRKPDEKAVGLVSEALKAVAQKGQLGNPDARVAFETLRNTKLLGDHADAYWGQGTGDFVRFGCFFWEIPTVSVDWARMQSTVKVTHPYGGRESVVFWEQGQGQLMALTEKLRRLDGHQGIRPNRGKEAWDKPGITVSLMRDLPVCLYGGQIFDGNCAALVPNEPQSLPAIWCFCSSPEYNKAVRRIDQKLNVTNATLVKVPFDLEHWQKIADQQYPNGLPKPFSNDPTQWIFHGHPCGSVVWNEETKRLEVASTLRTDDTVLQVAVARLLGYRWPAERDEELELSEEARAWVARARELEDLTDNDGIVCLPAVRGEQPAATRLRSLLARAFGDNWSAHTQADLLAAVGCKGWTLERWLQDRFFAQHCTRFHHRPFIWHIWDGLKQGGFSALVNYHKLCDGGSGGSSNGSSGFQPLNDRKRRSEAGSLCYPDTCGGDSNGGSSNGSSGFQPLNDRNDREQGSEAGSLCYPDKPCGGSSNGGSGFQPLNDTNKGSEAGSLCYSGRKHLETLTYTYLGDWIRRQQDGVKRGEDGAEERLAAANALQEKLKRILEGEPPCDIFVRWKAMEDQPMGWDPDINDGVRMNIRPFMQVGDVGKRGAGVLRDKPNIKWGKDRGKDPTDAPWYPLFKGERINDHHLTLAEKQAAREGKKNG